MLNLSVILISKDLCTKKKFFSIEFVARFSTSEHLFLFSNELVYNKIPYKPYEEHRIYRLNKRLKRSKGIIT